MFFKRDTRRSKMVRKILHTSVGKLEKEQEEIINKSFKKTIELVDDLLIEFRHFQQKTNAKKDLIDAGFPEHPKVKDIEAQMNPFWEGLESKIQIIENLLGEEYARIVEFFPRMDSYIKNIHDLIIELKKIKSITGILETLEEIKKRLSLEENLIQVQHIGAQQLLGNSLIKQLKNEIAEHLVTIIKKKFDDSWEWDINFNSKENKIQLDTEYKGKEGDKWDFLWNQGEAELVKGIGTPRINRETLIINIFPNKKSTSGQPIDIFVEYVVSKDRFIFSFKYHGVHGKPEELGNYTNIFGFAEDNSFIRRINKLVK